jgi:DNA-binding NtrC family response regulator
MAEKSDSGIPVLIVDDEVDFLAATAKTLTRRGFDIQTAPDGETALRMLGEQRYAAVVLDVRMPGMPGVDLYRRINAGWPGLPVIIMTGDATKEQAFDFAQLGVFAYLTKPCDVEKLAETIHRAAERDQGMPAEVLDRNAMKKIRLLVVDDERDFLEGLSRTLGRRGMKVTTADNGAAALEILSRQEFDVALLDVKMPGIDGIELMQRILKHYPRTQVLLLTGHPTMDQALKGVEMGAYDYLLKPQDIDTLSLKILAAFQDSADAKENV